jgi:hypothetical protein
MLNPPHPDHLLHQQQVRSITRGGRQAADSAAMEAYYDAIEEGCTLEQAAKVFIKTYQQFSKNTIAMETPFESALQKKDLNPEYWMERICKFPPDTWVMPTNREDDDYDVFSQLFELQLVARKYVPLWKDGMLKGARVYFMYNLDLKLE